MRIISVFCCLLHATWTEGAGINVEGFEREDVLFRCSHIFAWRDNKYLCKDPCNSSKDVLVKVKSGRRAESGRITLVDSGNGDFTVTFSRLQLSDAGKYWCGVDRPGFDSYTAVYLTVEQAVADETTTVTPDLSPTWTYLNISNSTQLPSGMDIIRHSNLSTASNYTNGEQSISTGTVLYTTTGAIVMFTIVVLVSCFRKCRKKPKPQPQVCSNSTDPVSADETEADCDYDDIDDGVLSLKQLSERFSCTHHPKQAPLTSAPAECSAPLHIYENICCSKSTADPRYSAPRVRDEHDTSSGIYINPLPDTISERCSNDSLGKHTNKPTATTESCTSTASACPSRSRSGSTEVRPRSLWFGLDLSGTVSQGGD